MGRFILIKRRVKQKSILISRKIILLFLVLSVFSLIPTFLKTNTISGATKNEAYEAIIQAFIKIEEASKESINVTTYVSKINSAIQDYNDGFYTEAYDKASEIIDELIELIASYKTGKLFPYILIPINIVCIAAIVVSLVRNIKNRSIKEQDTESNDLVVNKDVDD